MKQLLHKVVVSLIVFNALWASSSFSAEARNSPPTLEIFANQLPILIGRGQGKELRLTGAVYDGDINDGRVLLRPKISKEASCPIFNNGDNFGVTATANTTNVVFRLIVFVPVNHPLGEFTCRLSYSASQVNLSTGFDVPIKTKMNDVVFKYTVKNKFIF